MLPASLDTFDAFFQLKALLRLLIFNINFARLFNTPHKMRLISIRESRGIIWRNHRRPSANPLIKKWKGYIYNQVSPMPKTNHDIQCVLLDAFRNVIAFPQCAFCPSKTLQTTRLYKRLFCNFHRRFTRNHQSKPLCLSLLALHVTEIRSSFMSSPQARTRQSLVYDCFACPVVHLKS